MQNGETCCSSYNEDSCKPLISQSTWSLSKQEKCFIKATAMEVSSMESPVQMQIMSVHFVNGNVKPSLKQVCDNVSENNSQLSQLPKMPSVSNPISFQDLATSPTGENLCNSNNKDPCDSKSFQPDKPLTKVKLAKTSSDSTQEGHTGTPTRSNTCENCGQELVSKPQKSEEIEKSPSGSSIFTCNMSTTNQCRICHCESSEESGPLIAPCRCKGTLEFVHQSCLQQWIKSSDHNYCELCGFHFAMNSKLKPITKWEKLSMSTSERRKIICSVIFHVIATTCVIWSLYVLVERTADELRMGKLHWPFWTKLVVVAIGVTGGLIFMYVQCKVYAQLCGRLKAYNRIIYVQDQPTIPLATSDENENAEQSTSTDCHIDSGGVVVLDVCQETEGRPTDV